MTILVRDEEELLRANLEYHFARGVDFVIATDNRSRDRTPEILREYESKKLLKYIYEPDDDYSQDLWVTRMARIAALEYKMDWVIHADADEFWRPLAGTIKGVLAAAEPETDGFSVERSNFVPVAGYDTARPFYEQLIHRERVSRNVLGRALPPKVVHRCCEKVHVAQGNHSFSMECRDAVIESSSSLEVLHFPIRDYETFERRIKDGGRAYENNSRFSKAVGATWREDYRLLREGRLKSEFDRRCWTDYQLFEGLRSGKVVRDVGLRNDLRKLFASELNNISL